jgi:glycosyltransferase involved in cell wall biosynthesis
MIRNVLICTTQVPFTSGGAEYHVDGLQRALTDAGYSAEIVRLPFKWYPPDEIMRGALAWRLLDLTESNGKTVDLVIAMKFPCYLVAHPNKVLWIMHQHRSAYNLWGTKYDDLSTYPEGVRVREWIRDCDNRFIPQARKVFANSKTVADRLRRYNQIESRPLYHPPPTIDQLKTGDFGEYVFYPSRLEPQKRQELLIEALQFTRSPVQIVFAGGSHNLEFYRSLIKRIDVADRVKLLGFISRTDMVEWYANSLAVCYLPFDEDYGYVTLEGMLSAKPIIITRDSGGPTEFIENERDGLIVDPEPIAVADALDRLYLDKHRTKQMGVSAREKIMQINLSWNNVVDQLISAGT